MSGRMKRDPFQAYLRGSSGDDVREGYAASLGKDLIFSGEIGDQLLCFLWENLLRAGTRLDDDSSKVKEGRRLFLSSSGGKVYSMTSIIDLFEEVTDLSVIATGWCMSAAVPIVAAGTRGKRLATCRTRFMVHPVGVNCDSWMEKSEMAAETEEMRRTHVMYAEVMANYCKHNKAWWMKRLDCHKPWYFDAQTAMEHGIIDRVINSPDPGRPKVRRR